MIKAVIFDLDGLLIDTEIVAYDIYQDILREYGKSFSIDFYAEHYSGKTELHNFTDIIKRFDIPLTYEEGLQIIQKKEIEYMENGVELKPGAKQLIDYLVKNNIKIGLATSSVRKKINTVLNEHNIAQYFDEIVSAEETVKSKPDPEIYLNCLKKLDVSADECLVLEDSEAGVESAYNAHIPVINIPDMVKIDENHRNMTVGILKILTDVIDYIENTK